MTKNTEIPSPEFFDISLRVIIDQEPATVRFRGLKIVDDGRLVVFLTDDGRVVVHDENREQYWETDNPMDDLCDHLSQDAYCDLGAALDEPVVVDL
jgi:hypothetical protein